MAVRGSTYSTSANLAINTYLGIINNRTSVLAYLFEIHQSMFTPGLRLATLRGLFNAGLTCCPNGSTAWSVRRIRDQY